MSNVGKIRLKTFAELATTAITITVEEAPLPTISEDKTPEKKNAGKIRRAATTTRKCKANEESNDGVIPPKTAIKRSSKKTPLPGQMLIDSFFKSSAKNYKVEMVPLSTAKKEVKPVAKRKVAAKGRKRLFDESTTASSGSTDTCDRKPPEKRVQPGRKAKGKENAVLDDMDVIDLCSEDESEKTIKKEPSTKVEVVRSPARLAETTPVRTKPTIAPVTPPKCPMVAIPTTKNSPARANIPAERSPSIFTSSTLSSPRESPVSSSSTTTGRKQRKPKPCPPYKIVEGTTFCVDGFQFGDLDGVTHYFLSHYHADHYIGLTKKFSHPLYMSPITARLVRTFIKVDEIYIKEIEVDQTLMVDDVEVTAIEANHCPGALMFFFKLSSGECILHTGDFRANADMESLPIFWNHINIDLLYLDTTYMNKNYDFCHQTDSVDRTVELVRAFMERNPGKRILIVCGAYVIGKEKIWLALAEEFCLNVWTEPQRSGAVRCLHWPKLQLILTDDPRAANLHVIGLGKVSYPSLVEYFKPFEDQYDMLLGIRPSGWEKNSKPSYGKRISTIGIEYSEHSSYKELERFVRFLKPKRVISTVPVGRDLCVTGEVPTKWYRYEGTASMLSTGYQPTISTFLTTPGRRTFAPPVTAENNMILSPVEENLPTDCVTISYSSSETEIVVRNEATPPEAVTETIDTKDDTPQADTSLLLEIDIKSEGLAAGSQSQELTADKAGCDHGAVAQSSADPGENKADLASRLTSDASDDWLPYL
ncbi:DNA cross-link repair 1A protein [Drosophila kikkawai]|uniref:DNA cross-link repair 1A protein n=1 Tax=Drosophila kikkawai TaxID=30033 RepID=A0A6P4I3K7_DROKI|nr:DNA cross-link repair 1A protein [Drosophila kikkawai]